MSGSNKVIKSVSFNTANAEDISILEAIKRRNFSGYVKKLILEDLIAKTVEKNEIVVEPKLLTAAERLEQAKKRQKGGEIPPV